MYTSIFYWLYIKMYMCVCHIRVWCKHTSCYKHTHLHIICVYIYMCSENPAFGSMLWWRCLCRLLSLCLCPVWNHLSDLVSCRRMSAISQGQLLPVSLSLTFWQPTHADTCCLSGHWPWKRILWDLRTELFLSPQDSVSVGNSSLV